MNPRSISPSTCPREYVIKRFVLGHILLIIGLMINSPVLAQWSRIETFPEQDVTNLVVTTDWLYFSSLDSIYRVGIESEVIGPIGSLGPEIEVWSLEFVGDRLLAGTYGHGLYSSIDSGFTWVAQNSGLNGVALDISCIVARDNNVYIGTSGAGVFVSHLQTTLSWQPFRDGLGSLVAWSVFSIDQWNNILFTGAGENGYIFRNLPSSTTWEGYSFNMNIGTGLPMLDFDFLPSGEIIGAASNGIYTSNDTGRTWGFFPAPFGAGYYGKTIQVNGEVLTMVSHPVYGSYIWIKRGSTWELYSQIPGVMMTDLAYFNNRLYASSWTGIWISPHDPTAVDPENPNLPDGYVLSQNYPNPFNPTTTIAFSIPTAGPVVLTVFDLLGREVTRLVDEIMPVGSYTAEWDGTDRVGEKVASGVYLYQLTAGSFAQSQKMLLIK